MQDEASWLTSIKEASNEMAQVVIGYLPSLALAVLVLIAGLFLARFLRGAFRHAANNINRVLDRFLRSGPLASARLSTGATKALGELLFWAVIFLSIVIAARYAGLTAVAGWLNQIVEHLPNLLIGAAIIFVGHIVSGLAGEQVSESARNAKSRQSALLGRLAQSAIFITALIIGLDQIGVEVTFLVALFAIAIGSVFIGFSIAFGLGSRDYVSNLLGARAAQRELPPGRRVRIGEIEGEVLEITPTHIAVDAPAGRTLIPAHSISVESIVLVAEADNAPGDHG